MSVPEWVIDQTASDELDPLNTLLLEEEDETDPSYAQTTHIRFEICARPSRITSFHKSYPESRNYFSCGISTMAYQRAGGK